MSNISNAGKAAVKRSLGTLDEIAETLAGMRGKQEQYAVRQSDLVRLGLARYVGGKLVAQAAQEQGGTIVAPPPPPPAPTATLGMSLVASGSFGTSGNHIKSTNPDIAFGHAAVYQLGYVDTGYIPPAQNYQSVSGPLYLAKAYITGIDTSSLGASQIATIKAEPCLWVKSDVSEPSQAIRVHVQLLIQGGGIDEMIWLQGTINWSLYSLQVA